VNKSLLVIGAGLTGMFAAILAARRGASVRLIAEGRGGLSLSHGCIDTWRDGDVRFWLSRMDRGHPLRRAGLRPLEAGLNAFLDLMQNGPLAYVGGLDRVLRLPTSLGSIHPTAAAPATMASGSLDDPRPIHVGRLPALRDFSADLAAAGLRRAAVDVRGTVELVLPEGAASRDLYAHDIGARLEDRSYLKAAASEWKAGLHGVRRLGIPAVAGVDRPVEVLAALEEALGVELFEIPTLPPSLPGLRLERALRRLAIEGGVDLIEGASVRGEVDGRSAGRLVSGAVAATAGGPRAYRAGAVLLATGGPLHGGWLTFSNGEAQEAVFGLPIDAPADRDMWTSATLLEDQPYARFGLTVDDSLRPCDSRGRPFFENLFAAGGLLAGADRAREGSRQAIDLATAYAAVEAILS
jgi:glycerol-3-phosphate dehydrogenase subunit B